MSVHLTLATAPLSLEARYGKLAAAGSTEPSFGLVCLGTVAREAGAEVRLIEASAYGLTVAEAAASILEQAPDILGISCTTAGAVAAGELAAAVKSQRPECMTIIGGCHATAIPEETLREFTAFDMAVIGEGEDTLREIVEVFAETRAVPNSIAGTAVRCDSGIQFNPVRPLITDLNALPLPDWSLLPGFPQAYTPSPLRIKHWPCASIVLTRGCPNKCTFCDRSVFGNRCRAYSPEYAVQLVKDLRYNYGVRELLIEDDTFVLSRKRVIQFCDHMITDNVDVSWSCLGRADLVTPEVLATMKAAGCWHISFGIESGDPDMLKSVHKNMDLEQVRQALEWSRQAGLRTKGFFMIGFPGETKATIEATRRCALRLPLTEISVMLMTPFPGSELYETAGDYGTFEHDWRRMTAVDPVFVPHGFSRDDLEKERDAIVRAFYLRPRTVIDQFVHSLKTPTRMRAMVTAAFELIRQTAGTLFAGRRKP